MSRREVEIPCSNGKLRRNGILLRDSKTLDNIVLINKIPDDEPFLLVLKLGAGCSTASLDGFEMAYGVFLECGEDDLKPHAVLESKWFVSETKQTLQTVAP
nr:hypothetical protein CFP56_00437 [Quercus suber]